MSVIPTVERDVVRFVFYPKSLAKLLPAFLRGEAISEPLEVWP